MSLLCKLIGHRWEWVDKWISYERGEVWSNSRRVIEPFCTRCGQPSPKHAARVRIAARERQEFIRRAMEKAK